MEDLESSIELTEEALKIMPLNQAYRIKVLTNLGSRLSSRFAQKGSTEDLDRAIKVLCAVLMLTPFNHCY